MDETSRGENLKQQTPDQEQTRLTSGAATRPQKTEQAAAASSNGQCKTMSDSEIQHRILSWLSNKGIHSTGRVDIEVVCGRVHFRGVVSTFHERQLYIPCQWMPGVERVVDDLKVEIRDRDTDQRLANPRKPR